MDQSVYLPAGDRAGIERLVGYMTRCPFSLSRLVKVTKTGQVVYKAEKDACRAFPDPHRDELARGTQRNFQIFDPLEFLAEFTRPGVPGAPFRRRAPPDSRAPTEGWSRLVLEQGPRYWHNKGTGLTADVPGKAMLMPQMWGVWKFVAGGHVAGGDR